MRRRITDWWGFLTRPCVPLVPLLVWVLSAAVLVNVGIGLWKGPEWHVAAHRHGLSVRDRIELVNQTRATWAQIVAGAAGFLVIYLTWRRLTATERTVEISQEGQITERFTRAIEQLGSEKLEIRLGGIYALERIARDSEKDHWTIMEVLTAFVRENAPWRPEEAAPQPAEPPPLRADIQAILTVIGRRTRTYRNGEVWPLDLRRTDLRNANLRLAHLEGAHFWEGHLEGADLMFAHLEGADLWKARLEGASLSQADLRGAYLWQAHLEGADLGKARLEWARLWDAHLETATLAEARLDMAEVFRAHLEGANLWGTSLGGAKLIQAHLEGADLRCAVGLTRHQVDQAIIDANTKLPDYLASDEQRTSTSG
jgi:hypothetical protein